MHLRSIVLTIAAMLALSATGCENRIDDQERLIDRDDQFGEINFSGYAIDGVTGRVITDYELELVYGGKSKTARIDRETARFTVGGLPEASDFSIRITSAAYRPFESINADYNFTTEEEAFADGRRGYIFVAYLFPLATTAPDTTINVFFPDSNAPVPSGSVRLTPSNLSSSLETDFALVTPAPVPPAPAQPQVWQNSLDRLTGSVTVPITNGVASFAGNTLVYGVTYDIAVFGVAGYDSNLAETVTAGEVVTKDITLASAADLTLTRIYRSDDIYRGQVPPSTAISLTFVFNRQIEFTPNAANGTAVNALDANSTMSVIDTDGDGTTASAFCTNVDDLDAECGWTLTISGNTLTMSGIRQSEITTDDLGDRLQSVTFAGFTNIVLRPAGATTNEYEASLTSLNDGDDFTTITISQQ